MRPEEMLRWFDLTLAVLGTGTAVGVIAWYISARKSERLRRELHVESTNIRNDIATTDVVNGELRGERDTLKGVVEKLLMLISHDLDHQAARDEATRALAVAEERCLHLQLQESKEPQYREPYDTAALDRAERSKERSVALIEQTKAVLEEIKMVLARESGNDAA